MIAVLWRVANRGDGRGTVGGDAHPHDFHPDRDQPRCLLQAQRRVAVLLLPVRKDGAGPTSSWRRTPTTSAAARGGAGARVLGRADRSAPEATGEPRVSVARG